MDTYFTYKDNSYKCTFALKRNIVDSPNTSEGLSYNATGKEIIKYSAEILVFNKLINISAGSIIIVNNINYKVVSAETVKNGLFT